VRGVPGTKTVSQTQLAKELGISQALVSLVLNGRRQGISAATYQRIWAHAVKRGYHPKGMHLASSPVGQARQVAVILRGPQRLHMPSVYFGHVQHGVQTTLEAAGLTPVFIGSDDRLDAAKLRRAFPAGHQFQGIVVIGEVAPAFLDELKKIRLKLVTVAAKYPGKCHSVIGDETQALDSLVQHLFSLGHRRVGWLGGNVGLGRHESRFEVLEASLVRAGLALDPRYSVKLAQGDRAEGAEAVHAVLRHGRRKDFPTAFVCYNALMCDGAIKALARAQWHVPRDISIASAEISPVITDGKSRITAAGCCPEKLGEAAGRLLLEATDDGKNFTELNVPAELRLGVTTGPT
jgi:LacI family transcriptional regulator